MLRNLDYRVLSSWENGKFATPQKLPQTINTNVYEADVFVAPDESYLIFCSIRAEGLGRGDLYISFKDEKGNRQPAVHVGNKINTLGHKLCPFVSKVGNTFSIPATNISIG